FPGRVGDSDPDALKTAHIKGGEPRLVEERVVENGQVTPILAVEVAAEVQAHFGDAAPRVAVIGGRPLGPPVLETLHHQARLLGRDGTVLAGKLDGGAAHWPRRIIQLGDGANEGLARVEIVVPDDELARTLGYISWGTGALGLSALAMSLLLSVVVTRRTL